jgi:tetratricopeptide (TPR) repeat protein
MINPIISEKDTSGVPYDPWFINVPPLRSYGDPFPLIQDKDVEKAWDRLEEHGVCGVVGLGGVGKTTLAVKLIERKKSIFNCVLWIKGESADTFAESVSKIGDEINALRYCKHTGDSERQVRKFCDVHVSEKVEAVKQWITNRTEDLKNVLVVIDGCNDFECSQLVLQLVPEKLLGDRKLKFLVTSQCRNLSSIKVYENQIVYLDILPADFAVKALEDTARKNVKSWTDKKEEKEAAFEIAELVGYLPLGVEHVRSFIRTRRMSLSRYIKECRTSSTRQLPIETCVYGNPQSTIYNVFDRSCKQVFKESPPAEMMMTIALSCAKCPIPLQLFSVGSIKLPKSNSLRKLSDRTRKKSISSWEEATARDGNLRAFYDICARLQNYHLVTIEESDTFTVHPAIRTALRYHQTEKQRQESFSCLGTLLATVFEGSPTIFWHLYDRLVPHMMKWYRKMESMSTSPNLPLLLDAGKRLSLSGYFTDSCLLLDTCLRELERSEQGRQCPLKARVLYSLGSAKRRLGKLSEAVKYTRQARQLWRKLSLDPESSKRDIAKTNELYAEILLDVENYHEAGKILKKCVGDVRLGVRSNVVDMYELTSCLVNLGSAHAGMGNHDKALDLFKESADRLRIEDNFRYHLYMAHIHLASARKNLKSNQFEDYKDDYRECLQLSGKIELRYGPKHRYYLFLCREIAKLVVEEDGRLPTDTEEEERAFRDRLSKALDMCKISLEGHIKVYKSKHQKVAKAAEVAAHVFLLWAKHDIEKDAQFFEASLECLDLATMIWKETVKELPKKICSAIDEKYTELQKLQTEVIRKTRSRGAALLRRLSSPDRLADDAVKAVARVADSQQIQQNAVTSLGRKRRTVVVICIFLVLVIIHALYFTFYQ